MAQKEPGRAVRRRQSRVARTDNLNWVVGILVLVAVIAIGVLMFSLRDGGGGAAIEPVELGDVEDPRTLVQLARGIGAGDPSAPIRVIEFADYQCPGCRDFALQIKPLLLREYVETGQVHFTYYDFPLTQIHDNAFLAARAARCAGDQERYWDYHDVIYARQGSWSPQRTPIAAFTTYAGEIGLDEAAFESCLRSDRHADVVSANARLGLELGVTGTPTVFVNSRVAQPRWDRIRETIEQELGR